MENTMASSNVDDKLKKDTENKETGNKETNKILTFIKQNVRYITKISTIARNNTPAVI